jgi:hypothetical protein
MFKSKMNYMHNYELASAAISWKEMKKSLKKMRMIGPPTVSRRDVVYLG